MIGFLLVAALAAGAPMGGSVEELPPIPPRLPPPPRPASTTPGAGALAGDSRRRPGCPNPPGTADPAKRKKRKAQRQARRAGR